MGLKNSERRLNNLYDFNKYTHRSNFLHGAGEQFAAFLEAVLCESPIRGLTHNFYRYPARFSPQFARKAIEAFTEPGDTILDPFMGGGTTVVESLALGRRCVGSDLNPLCRFITKVKSTPISPIEAKSLLGWGQNLIDRINLHSDNTPHRDWIHYQRNMPWWLRKSLEVALDSIGDLPTRKQREFARASLIKTAQWALDNRSIVPTKTEFLLAHNYDLNSMIAGALSFREQLRGKFRDSPSLIWRNRRLLRRSAIGIHQDKRIPREWLPPRLVLTSPPYFAVHIRYHRWQVRGRRETAAPYWLAGCRDGHGEAYYTFTDRKKKDIEAYLDMLKRCFASITALLGKNSLVVQLVGFSDPGNELDPYLKVMRDVGLEEVDIRSFSENGQRLWRTVPNRKWYVDQDKPLSTNREVLLVHQKAHR